MFAVEKKALWLLSSEIVFVCVYASDHQCALLKRQEQVAVSSMHLCLWPSKRQCLAFQLKVQLASECLSPTQIRDITGQKLDSNGGIDT